MRCKDNIEWLKSLKQQIGQTQYRDLWHFEQVIDETIENLKPLAKPHGRLIDADALRKKIESIYGGALWTFECFECIRQAPTIIEAEVSE